ncbi:DUF192 domain-containing protein [Natrinema salifodinae]|uniref:DUF192 domain-containing protein n=1 Tax=Natrinema salifodinae TaxID=1202768 RepID=A0A1I0NRY0_9EURY|nr:DUF192 domain-containing protein [Natrinema salifodinae]SEW04241.1 hypothetical protein SAMN05216285_2048 [Natrinema salifodinae]
MAFERVWKGLLAIALLSIVGVALVQAGIVSTPWGADEGHVRVFGDESDGDAAAEADDREPKAVVDVEVADTRRERYVGLSNHDSLESGNGMLFVHDDEDERTYVMRDMDFDIDIIFIDADREITTIHHARAPEAGEDGEDLRYSGQAKWVLEVPRGDANETDIAVGDEVEIDLESN